MKPDQSFRSHALSNNDQTLGKRHNYEESGSQSFRSTAISIGFSEEELRRLRNLYFRPAKSDPLKKDGEI